MKKLSEMPKLAESLSLPLHFLIRVFGLSKTKTCLHSLLNLHIQDKRIKITFILTSLFLPSQSIALYNYFLLIFHTEELYFPISLLLRLLEQGTGEERSSFMAVSPSPTVPEKKHWWWLTNKKIVDKYIKDAKILIATQEPGEIAAALPLLDAALALSPGLEEALELKARSLLHLQRFKDVADLLQDYIPSLKTAADGDDSGSVSSDGSSHLLSRDHVKLLLPSHLSDHSPDSDTSFKCFSVSDLKKKFLPGMGKDCEKDEQWRYLVLGQACCHLGLMEDAMVLLQTGKRLATAALRRQSISWSEDSFNVHIKGLSVAATPPSTPPHTPISEREHIVQLLTHIKFLIRRRTAAIAALDAGLYSEAIRHFSKIVNGRRPAPQGFLAECYMNRAFAYKAAGRIAESVADCNKTLALDPSCIEALETRASLLETIRCLPDCLHDLEHLKLLYNSILRDRKLPGPAWKRHNVRYSEIPERLSALTAKIEELKRVVASGGTGSVDYHALIGLRRGCSRSELEKAHLLLILRHKPDRAIGFLERCELADGIDVETIQDRAKMSALMLYRLLQKGYSSLMAAIIDEEAADKQRRRAAAAIQAQGTQHLNSKPENEYKMPEKLCGSSVGASEIKGRTAKNNTNVFEGVFCRDLAAVGDLLSQVGFNRQIPVKYEALSW